MGLEFAVLLCLKVFDSRLYFSLPLNLCTNLLLNSLLSLTQSEAAYWIYLLLGEALVVYGEAKFYGWMKSDPKNVKISLAANAVSFFVGGGMMSLLSLVFA